MFSCEFCEISKNNFFCRTPLVAASGDCLSLAWASLVLSFNFKEFPRITFFFLKSSYFLHIVWEILDFPKTLCMPCNKWTILFWICCFWKQKEWFYHLPCCSLKGTMSNKNRDTKTWFKCKATLYTMLLMRSFCFKKSLFQLFCAESRTFELSLESYKQKTVEKCIWPIM